MEITFRPTKSDLWRCELWHLKRQGVFPGKIVATMIVLMAIVNFGGEKRELTSYFEFLFSMCFGIVAICAVVMLLQLAITVNKRVDKDGLAPISTARLDNVGFHLLTGDKRVTRLWGQPTSLIFVDGDIHFYDTLSHLFVPRSAWLNAEDAKRLYKVCHDTWLEVRAGRLPTIPTEVIQGTCDSQALPDGDGVWPPAPKLIHPSVANTGLVKITYRSSKSETISGSFGLLFGSVTLYSNLFSICLLSWLLESHMQVNDFIRYATPPVLCLLFVCWLAVKSVARTNSRLLPDGFMPECSTYLDAYGIHDVSTDHNLVLPWQGIRRLAITKSHLLFATSNRGVYVPKSAWKNSSDAREFFNLTRSAYKQAKLGYDPTLPNITFEGVLDIREHENNQSSSTTEQMNQLSPEA